jgi:hypothetical protein
LQTTYPLGPQTVRMKLPAGVRVKTVEVLKGGHTVPFVLDGQTVHFTVPRVEDYEVAAITLA